jgi:hypothetical protein
VKRGEDEVVEEIRHGLRPQDDPVGARRNPLAAEGPDRPVRRLDARLVREVVEPGAVHQPEPFASMVSTMPVVAAVMSVDSSVWTSGGVDTMAARSCTIVITAEEEPQRRRSSSLPEARRGGGRR